MMQSKAKKKAFVGRGQRDVVFLALTCLQSFQFRELSLAKFQGHTANSPGNSRPLPPHLVTHYVTGIVLLTC